MYSNINAGADVYNMDDHDDSPDEYKVRVRLFDSPLLIKILSTGALELYYIAAMEPVRHRYFLLNKPCGMVSQFISPDAVKLLGELPFRFPEGIHAIGRLDKDSEGLLLLTTNKKITALVFESKMPHKRTYLVQVRYKMGEGSVHQLRNGVAIRIEGGAMYTTRPCEVSIVEPPKDLFPSLFNYPPHLASTWLMITLTEGKYRQVRKMVAAVRHPCMRLIRVSIEDLTLGDLQPGEVKEIGEDAFFTLLKLEKDPIQTV